MERSESGWGQPAEPPPRWRALLDRALLGRSGEQRHVSAPPAPPDGQARARAAVDGARYHPGTAYPEQAYPDQTYAEQAYADQAYPAHTYPGTAPPDQAPPDRPYPDPSYPDRPDLSSPDPAPPDHARPGRAYSSQAYAGTARPSQAYADPAVRPEQAYAGSGYAAPVYPGQPSPDRELPGQAPPGQSYPGQIEWRQPAERDDDTARAIAVLRRDLTRPRVLAFANPKGGVHKTTATALAAATVGSVRGRGVLAWDDNELRGTLGLRAGSARHARTIRHLIADLAEVEACGGLELADRVDDYLRHASDGTYDVLAGEENPRFAQQLDQHTVRRVLELLRRTHDVVCVDTGNNVESPNWQTVLQAADQLVITTVPREDAAFTADWMLDLLYEQGMGQLAEEAVTLLSCATPGHQPLLSELEAHFATRTRAVVVVPYDPALESGSAIEPSMLAPATKQAWLHAAATILENLTR